MRTREQSEKYACGGGTTADGMNNDINLTYVTTVGVGVLVEGR